MMDTVISCAGTVAHHLWSVSWQVSILIAVIWLVDLLSFRASSLFRYWLWCIVLVRLCIPVSIELPTGIDTSFTERIELRAPKFSELPILQTLPDEFEPLSPQEKMVLSESSVQKSILPSLTAAQWLGIFWIFSVTAIVLALFAHVIVISRRLKRCKPIYNPELVSLLKKLSRKIGISRSVEPLYLDESIGDVPAVAGFVRPRIFLPPRLADNWEPWDLEPILLHELAHIRRSDLLINWLQIIVQTVYFFHPLVWYANRRIRLLREEVCDDIAVHMIGDKRKWYTKSMLDVVKTAVREPSLGFVGIGFTERKSTIRARISRILSDTYRAAVKLSVLSVILLITIGGAGISISCKKSVDIHREVKHDTNEPVKKYTKISIKEKGKYTIDGFDITEDFLEAYIAQEYAINGSLNILLQADFHKQLDDIIFIMKMIKSRKHLVEIDITHPETKEAKRAKLSLYDGDDPEFIDGIIVDYGSDTQEIKKNNKTIKMPNTFLIKRREKPTGSDIKSLFESARDHVKYKEHDKAISCYKKIINDFPDDPQIDNAWVELGYAYHASGIEDEMVRAFRNVSRNNKELFTTAWFLAAQALQKENRHEDVIDIISYAVKDTSIFDVGDNRKLSQLFIMRGNAYRYLKRYDDALADYDRTYNYNQHDIKEIAVLYSIDIFIEQKRFEIAERELKKLMKSNNDQIRRDAQIRLDQLRKAGDNSVETDIEHPDTGRIERAEVSLPESNGIVDDLLLSFFQDEKSSGRKSVIKLESKIKANSLRVILNGDTLSHWKDYTYNPALNEITLHNEKARCPDADLVIQYEAVEEDLDNLRLLMNTAMKAKKYIRVVRLGTKILESENAEGKKPQGKDFYYKEEAYYYLATNAENQEDYRQAIDYLLKGYKSFPNSYFSSDMLLKVGVIYLTKLNTEPDALDLAAINFEKYISSFPDTPNAEMAHYYLGFCYYNGRRFPEAHRVFSSFTTKYPRSEFAPEAYFYSADSNYNLGKLKECIKGFDIVIDRYTDHEKAVEAMYTKAWALLDLKKDDEAVETFKSIYENYPESPFAPSALFSLGDYYFRKQKHRKAGKFYNMVIEYYPESEVAGKARESLKKFPEH